ncbi:MAG: nitroreductase family protein [Desulfobacterales bacterium]|nr:nitroreductase family protein [Desulfobacterales bacterium]
MEIRKIEDKCIKCMLCVKDCIAGVIRNIDGEAQIVQPDLCNLCSHCVAVCPKGAIYHDGLDAKDLREIKKELISSESYKEIAITRRSIRNYKDKSVPKEIIEDIIDIARYSPTASNLQDVGYTIVTDKHLLKKVSNWIFGLGNWVYSLLQTTPGKTFKWALEQAEATKSAAKYFDGMDYYKQQSELGKDYILHNAPVLILIHSPSGMEFASDNCNISAANITNYAHSLGLGTCYIGFLTLALRYDPILKWWLDIPKDRQVYSSLVMGYPSYSHAFTVCRKKAFVKWI